MENDQKVQYIKGNDSYQDEFIDFINYVFHFNGHDYDFYRLLPKLYKRENHACEYNYMALENGRIKAAVGSFPGEMNAGGYALKYYGIGNVAVHPYCRSKGYMKKLMDQALEDMLAADVDFSVLGGRRQRYAYFSYEIVGRKYCFQVNGDNIRHFFGKDHKRRFNFSIVGEEDKETLKKIHDLQKQQPMYHFRVADKLYDILKSWGSVDIYAIYEDTDFAGYLLCYDKNNIKEIILNKQEDIHDVIADFYQVNAKADLNIELPEYQKLFIGEVAAFAEHVSIQDRENFSVFNYDKVILAFLALKAQIEQLPDGEIVLLIHGKKRDEKLLISVKNSEVSVIPTDRNADVEYSHSEAMIVLFGNYSSLRSKLPWNVQSWLPLPITLFPADEV